MIYELSTYTLLFELIIPGVILFTVSVEHKHSAFDIVCNVECLFSYVKQIVLDIKAFTWSVNGLLTMIF